jgi:carboxypeptidase Q
MVPRWVRGRERAALIEPHPQALSMLGLGGSVGTGPDGIQGEVLVVHSFEELDAAGALARQRIVLFNTPFTTYADTVRFRNDGASAAARYGARAVLVRSIAPPDVQLPHTGAVVYSTDAPRIPAAAVTTNDADFIDQLTIDHRVIVELRMDAHVEPDAMSANLIGELRGRERPNEIVVIGGHIDSWDVGPGASDDGGGCIVTWEALRLMKKLHLRPRRTVRVVLWTNEENGGRGARAYVERHRGELDRHLLLLESDVGVARPLGFGFSGPERMRDVVLTAATLLEGLGANHLLGPGGGADVDPIAQAGHRPALSLETDSSRLFVVHHTAADTVDRINPQEMAKCAAAVAVMAYVMADIPAEILEQR